MSDKTPKKKAYKLCAMPTTEASTAAVEKQRFSRITQDYTLVYTSGKIPAGSLKLAESDASRLTDADRRWLDDCNAVLIAEAIAKDRPRILHQLSDLLTTIESNIQKAQTAGEMEGAETGDDGHESGDAISA